MLVLFSVLLLVPNTMLCYALSLSLVRLFVTPRTVALQAPLSKGFFKQEYWSGLPCPPPGDLDSGIKLMSLMSPALTGGFSTTNTTWEAPYNTVLDTW